MLSPGDVVFLDGEEKKGLKGKRWEVADVMVIKEGPDKGVHYLFKGWPYANEYVSSKRITAHWVET